MPVEPYRYLTAAQRTWRHLSRLARYYEDLSDAALAEVAAGVQVSVVLTPEHAADLLAARRHLERGEK